MQVVTENIESILAFLASLSLFTFTISILAVPLLVSKLPRDYFSISQSSSNSGKLPLTLTSLLIFLARNGTGLLLVLAGIAMLFLPGQGILTMIVGIGVMSFPYKQHLMFKLTRPIAIQNSMNWMRKKTGKHPFHW